MTDYSRERQGRSEYDEERMTNEDTRTVKKKLGKTNREVKAVPLSEQLEYMGGLIGALQESTSMLEKRLSPIMIREPEDSDSDGASESVSPFLSPVQETIEQFFYSINRTIERLDRMSRKANL